MAWIRILVKNLWKSEHIFQKIYEIPFDI
jgi:hypothetical protein